jgi:hypothetical protein
VTGFHQRKKYEAGRLTKEQIRQRSENNMRNDDLVRIVDQQNKIIRIQSGAIDKLFRLLSQHIAAEELDNLPVIADINLAAQIRAEIE